MNLSKSLRCGLCSLFAFALLTYPAMAAKSGGKKQSSNASSQEHLDLAKEISDVNGLEGKASQPRLQKAFMDSLAQEAGVNAAKLKADKQKSGMGYGDLLVGEAIAQGGQSTFDAIQQEHAAKSWPDVAQGHNVPLKTLIAKLKAVQKDVDKEQKDEAKDDQKQQQLQQAQARAAQEAAQARRHRRR